jgi:FtsX-like permease family protein
MRCGARALCGGSEDRRADRPDIPSAVRDHRRCRGIVRRRRRLLAGHEALDPSLGGGVVDAVACVCLGGVAARSPPSAGLRTARTVGSSGDSIGGAQRDRSQSRRRLPSRTKSRQAGPTERSWRAKSAAAITEEDSPVRRLGLAVVALVALVLVVACTNLVNLVLARGTIRQQEVAVRCALGASRRRLVREQLAESLLLAVGGAVASCVVFRGLSVLMETEFQLHLPIATRSVQPSLDGPALATAAAALLISLVSAPWTSRVRVSWSAGSPWSRSSKPRPRRIGTPSVLKINGVAAMPAAATSSSF